FSAPCSSRPPGKIIERYAPVLKAGHNSTPRRRFSSEPRASASRNSCRAILSGFRLERGIGTGQRPQLPGDVVDWLEQVNDEQYQTVPLQAAAEGAAARS